eukprot:scaffold2033_cov164-Amphora_coffeaeformis.AAC.6
MLIAANSKYFLQRVRSRSQGFCPLRRNSMQTMAEYHEWRADIRRTAMPTADISLQKLPLKKGAPFLHSVSPITDRLELAAIQGAVPKSPRDSLLQCKYPLATDELLRNSVADFSNWSTFRLGKFYEIVDALTADVAYRHGDEEGKVTFVTAGHYHSRKFERTRIHEDLIVRSYVTSVGRSSMEVRTDAIQYCPHNPDKEILLNVCHTIMVALDSESMKTLSKVGKKLTPLNTQTEDDKEREALAQKHQQIRSQWSAQAMQLRSPVSVPPTFDEMKGLHQLYVALTRKKERATTSSSSNGEVVVKTSLPPMISAYTFRSSTIIYPEQRNVHGKLDFYHTKR